jgi:glutathione S-transferase
MMIMYERKIDYHLFEQKYILKVLEYSALGNQLNVIFWMLENYHSETLENADSMIFGAARLLGDTAAQTELSHNASQRVRDMYALVDKHLAGREWLSDGRSVADAYLYVTLRWASAKKIDIADMPNLQAHFKRMSADPAVEAALAAEGMK